MWQHRSALPALCHGRLAPRGRAGDAGGEGSGGGPDGGGVEGAGPREGLELILYSSFDAIFCDFLGGGHSPPAPP